MSRGPRGFEHIISLRNRRGLATAFTTGIDTALKLGADFIVNTDGDNQYAGADISALVAPLVSGEADVVIGDRNVETAEASVVDAQAAAASGKLGGAAGVEYTRPGHHQRLSCLYPRSGSADEYCLGVHLHARIDYPGRQKADGDRHVPIRSNPKTRPSRLFDNVWVYIKRSASTILRIYTMYEPFKVFTTIGLLTFGVGLAISCRFLYFYLNNDGSGHVQSLLLAAVLMIVGFQVLMIGLVADVISANRKLLEDLLYRVRSMELDKPKDT